MKWKLFLATLLSVTLLTACGSEEANGGNEEKNTIEFGATVGPYSDMVTNAITPLLEEKGYEVNNTEFTDYIQPNNALHNGDIDANLFQHKIYYEAFAEENGMDLSEVIIVPTAPMGLYSNSYDSVEAIEEGSKITIANDPTNLARTLIMLEDAGLIEISNEVDPLKASVKDIVKNPKNIEFQEVEAAQLPRLVDSEDASAVPGNFALSADMDLLDALVLEDMPDDYRNRVVVNTADMEEQWVKDIKEIVESDEFEQIIDDEFQGFGKPQWMLDK
ncbi:lipoprotein [Oceanobacillus iheyensis HTE831]|uniref:Lipoprotein n=1 Tax=Oceanobacillus iheyensis (strain DSM 14371 / CIP 107618 / JCM 11309 / KCTC 3954 / HTE831) TaxID=221109 RepID=Q8EPK3_OCEIH|nr:MetQ/NlpA family ABC transporter substrate-binding protein [Oceanobacillus iheyensis]BAC14054.1 lipoprotein [Oceanobacillus iheyensis HTE831]